MADLDFDLTATPEGERTRITLRGELDLGSAGRLEQALSERPGAVVLDLRSLTFMDSTGVRVLLEAVEHAERTGRRLHVVPPSGGDARRTIDETGIASLLPLEEAA